MTTLKTLEDKFSAELFDNRELRASKLKESIKMIQSFVDMEQCVAVLSDLAENKSYIFVGAFGNFFGMKEAPYTVINSIWEEDIYNRVHPDDIFERHLLELEYYNFIKSIPPQERLDYTTECTIRAKDSSGEYRYITHRSRYIRNSSTGGVWLQVCLYNYAYSSSIVNSINARINNIRTGESISVKTYNNCSDLLSSREKEILQHISLGLLSKEIAERLTISINTVNRHRQNILEKLKVNNSIEAVRTATALHILT